MKENAIYTITVQAMPYGRYFSVVDDTDQRMPVGMSEVAAVVAYVFYFHNLTHGFLRFYFSMLYTKIRYSHKR